MKIKDFLKSVTLKCIVVLLCISLVSGGLLSIAEDIFYVSEEESVNRVISTLYGDPDVTNEKLELTEEDQVNMYGTVNSVYVLSDGNLIINTTGGNGYKGGSVTMWTVVILKDGKLDSIKAVKVDSYDKQTLMSQFNAKFLATYSSSTEELQSGAYFASGSGDGLVTSIASGATMSSNAINNAVNAALKFTRVYTGEEVVSDLVNGDYVADATYVIDGTKITYTLTAKTVASGMPNDYKLEIVVDNGVIESVKIKLDGATGGYGDKMYPVSKYAGLDRAALEALINDSAIKTGATNTNKTILNALVYATANYQHFLDNPVEFEDPMQIMLDGIYGEGAVTYSSDDVNADYASNNYGVVTEVYTISNGDTLLKARNFADKYSAYVLINSDGTVNTVIPNDDVAVDVSAYVGSDYFTVASDAEKAVIGICDSVNAALNYVKYVSGDETYLPYAKHVKDVNVTADGTKLVVELTAKTVAAVAPNDYKLKVTVDEGKVVSVLVVFDGATYGYDQYFYAVKNYVGMDQAALEAFLTSSTIVTGATNSNKTVVQAILYTVANYNTLLEANK